MAFSSNHLANELALNSIFSVTYSLYRQKYESDPQRFYGAMETSQMIDLVRATISSDKSLFSNAEVPFERLQEPMKKLNRPRNVVIFLQESLGAEYVGYLQGLPLTPNLDELSRRGLAFTKMFSTGTRTVRGIEAVVASFLPTPGSSVVKLDGSKIDFFTAAELFKAHGYETDFIYGGDSNFDEMKSFLVNNGMMNFYDLPTFSNPVFVNEWGASDEDLVRKANQVFKNHGEKPFFSVMLSTSSHHPWEFPDGRIKLYEQPKETFNNSVKYADFAIGEFFRLAEKEDYFKNTIFVVIADHSTRVYGNEFIPIKKFHIPAVIVGPDVPKINYDKPASQVDILPTILHFAGFSARHTSLGRNIMTLDEKDPGRAIMQYYNNFGYLLGDKMIILLPQQNSSSFRLRNFELVKSDDDFAFTKEAKAHAVVPWYLYSHRKYKMSH